MEEEREGRTKCEICISGCKQVTTFTLSHVGLLTLVVCYCCMGAAMFRELEAGHELDVKDKMVRVRKNVSVALWNITHDFKVINESEWKEKAKERLKAYEEDLVTAMHKEGWDGNDDKTVQNWTLLGALFYSIIVITTIGYGHIAPKTTWGKIGTIFYAIIGIPLMVVCWSHIGDFLANAFRFGYWKVCCYICTRNPRGRRGGSMGRSRRSLRAPTTLRGGSIRMRPARSIRRSMRASQRSGTSAGSGDSIADSIASDPGMLHRGGSTMTPKMTQPRALPHPAFRYYHHPRSTKSAEPEFLMSGSSPIISGPPTPASIMRNSTHLPVLCNKYAEEFSTGLGDPLRSDEDEEEEDEPIPIPNISRSRNRSAPPAARYTAPRPLAPEELEVWDEEDEDLHYGDDPYYDDYDEYWDDRQQQYERRQVPIWLCAFLVLSYIMGGAYMFSKWEGWPILDSAYFCFITLTTIGFGDFVPAQKFKESSEEEFQKSIVLCSLYLLFGIALLAMSFNLVQEQVINAFKDLALQLGIISEDEVQ